MIPKKIHYCWFGEKELPDNIKRCIETWKEKLKEYEIVEWNLDNIDPSINLYLSEAISANKWAFASDYVRLYVLYKYGGIYLDTDVEVLKSFDDLLDNHAFSGFESKGTVASWIMASEKDNPLFKEFIDYYTDRHFIKKSGRYDLLPNTIPISNICRKYDMQDEDCEQKLKYITIYPESYFCTKSIIDGKVRITDNSYTIHYFDGTWQTDTGKKIKKLKYRLFGLIGSKYYPIIRKKYRKIIGMLP